MSEKYEARKPLREWWEKRQAKTESLVSHWRRKVALAGKDETAWAGMEREAGF
jgi:hypothetical protein